MDDLESTREIAIRMFGSHPDYFYPRAAIYLGPAEKVEVCVITFTEDDLLLLQRWGIKG